MDIRAMNKRIELYRERTEKIRAEYRERQQQAEQENPDEAAQAETVQTQDGHDDEAHA